MSFFNLTQLGVQDPVNHAVKKPGSSPLNRPTETRTAQQPTERRKQVHPNSEADGSYVKYTERLHKHIRPENGPNEIYDRKISTNYEYGWWMRDGVQDEAWTKNKNHPVVKSEMTRFVDEMTLTNREFTLF
ncbi:predicted protein [Nematostella vectensis]|uniref:Uncharacterized protein n=1 Tax=Nematostella vectensis TaxID=45351 RepID=A7S008_NEMVE|nr:testis-expressed protein 49 [Nematostella vectensis]EDO42881.1 predicted protein [Nematostella vectensis]|eukprot:XP_001634944.1 predicted protein [Nematostella vectensis]